MTNNKGVMIVGEVVVDPPASITGELLGIGRRLADDLGQELSEVLIGKDVTDCARKVISLGADRVYGIDNQAYKAYVTDSYTGALHTLVEGTAPEIVLMGHIPLGRDLAPRLAFRLGTGVTLDCIDLTIEPDTKLLQKTKQVYGGNTGIVCL